MPDRAACVQFVVLLTAASSGPVAAQTSDAFTGIPGVTIAYYLVDGGDAMAVRRSIDALRPTDAHDGTRVDALSGWTMRWSWPRTRRGCTLAAATVRFRATVTMPRLAPTARLTKAERTAWDGYVAGLARHEAGHVRYSYDHHEGVLAAIRGATCATADRAAAAALASLDAYHVGYDRETGHGRTQGASFP